MKKFRNLLTGLVESDAAYGASLKKIAHDEKIKSLSKRDRETLMRIADMMKNANRDDIKHEVANSPEERRKERLARMQRQSGSETHRDRQKRLGKPQTEETELNEMTQRFVFDNLKSATKAEKMASRFNLDVDSGVGKDADGKAFYVAVTGKFTDITKWMKTLDEGVILEGGDCYHCDGKDDDCKHCGGSGYVQFKDDDRDSKITSKDIKMAIGIANDPRYKGGNYSAAYSKIAKLKKGLVSHPRVKDALRQANESVNLDESKLTLSTPMYNAIMKMGLPQLMKKHDAHVDRKETDKEHTTLSGERGFGTEVSKLIKKNASKLKKILSESVVEGDKLRMVNKDGDIRYVERDKVKKYQEKGYRADTKSAVEKSGNISRTDAFANVKRIAKELQKESPNRYSPLQMAKAKKEREERRKKSGDSERNRYQRLKQRQYGSMMGGLKDDFAYIEATLEENYRTLATKGMGTETPSSANNIKKNDIEMDYYDASGSKRRGKISNIDNETYTVRDLDDGKYRKYKFLDREKAKEYLKKENINENDMSLDDIKKKWAKEIIAFQDNGKDLPSSAMSDFYGYRDSDSIKTDDPDEFDDFVMGLQMGKYREALGLKEASAKADAMKAIKRDRDFQQVKDVDVRATTADMKLAKKNPIVQLRKILDYKGGTMEFLNKKKLKLKSDEADALLRGFDSLQKVQDKEKYQLLISKDPASLKKILKIVKR